MLAEPSQETKIKVPELAQETEKAFSELVKESQIRTGQDRSEQVRTGQDSSGQVRKCATLADSGN